MSIVSALLASCCRYNTYHKQWFSFLQEGVEQDEHSQSSLSEETRNKVFVHLMPTLKLTTLVADIRNHSPMCKTSKGMSTTVIHQSL